jgi:hypothetical protein
MLAIYSRNNSTPGNAYCLANIGWKGARVWCNILPVVQITVSLGTLSGEVDGVAGEEKVVLRRDGEGVAHEGCGVDDQGAGHLAGDAVGLITS